MAAAFGVPSESPDVALLQAWLTRNPSTAVGLVLRMPNCRPAHVSGDVMHMLQRLFKVRHF
jgi:hypothetical protein